MTRTTELMPLLKSLNLGAWPYPARAHRPGP